MLIPEITGLVSVISDYPIAVIGTVCVVVGFFILNHINATHSNVSVGLLDSAARDMRHGTIWMQDVAGDIVRKDVWFDKPHLLDEPNRYQIHNIFEQIRGLGYEPDHLEMLIGDKIRVYRPDVPRPICTTVRRYA